MPPGRGYSVSTVRLHATRTFLLYRTIADLRERSGEFERVVRSVGIQHLGASRFEQLSCPIAPLNEQRRIADEFDLRQRRQVGSSE